jgi:hypothetical protein
MDLDLSAVVELDLKADGYYRRSYGRHEINVPLAIKQFTEMEPFIDEKYNHMLDTV